MSFGCARRLRPRSPPSSSTRPTRGFARGFSIQTVGPLPIDWGRHVLADGHWGLALREYMRDYNHWHTLGALSELLPLPENQITIASEVTDTNGIPVARMDYSQRENDRKNIAMAKRTLPAKPAPTATVAAPNAVAVQWRLSQA